MYCIQCAKNINLNPPGTRKPPTVPRKSLTPITGEFTFKLVDFLFVFNLRKRLAASVCTSEPPFNGVSGLLKATCQPAKSNGLRGNPRLKQLLPCWGSIQRLALGSQVSLRKHIEQLPPRAKPLTKVVEKHLSGGTRMLNAGGKSETCMKSYVAVLQNESTIVNPPNSAISWTPSSKIHSQKAVPSPHFTPTWPRLDTMDSLPRHRVSP